MMSSLLSSNPAVNSDRSSTRRKKKKKIHHDAQIQADNQQNISPIQWKSDAQQQIYSSKLLHALQQVRLGSSGSEPSAPRRVRDAAYGVLAATARGRSRWSRAILTNRLKLKFMKKNNIAKRQRKMMTVIAAGNQPRKKSKVGVLRLKSKCLPAFQRKARVLSRLVPGCRKQPLPVVLEETTDYIAALEMQVRAMSALAELLTVSGSSSSSTATAQPGSVRTPPN
ncbi:transcription factor bHLH148-like [Salvia miltiorrhiza]|uniref:BHLH transcription factor 148 n=1 Tax=Salvia miltiorrhiza TaxID=226208 RepID=A0A386GYU1_SALMI|nr:transcription factor bHLH148-like [Salvia miltiorrhiza]AYD38343.1 bHLH transcription factor 148 [Salvia miltiorrhiza]